MAIPFYKNTVTGNYGVLKKELFPSQSTDLQLQLLIPVGGIAELSDQYEKVTRENLVEVSRDEVQKGMFNC